VASRLTVEDPFNSDSATRIGFLLESFPTLSQTFVINQITGLIDRGFDVRIYARNGSRDREVHAAVEKYGLIGRTYYFGSGLERLSRNSRALQLVKSLATRRDRRVWASLNVMRFGKQAVNLKKFLLFEALVASGLDCCHVVICHFGTNGLVGSDLKQMGLITGKMVVVFHGYDITKYIGQHGSQVYSRLFELCDLVLPISERWKTELVILGCDLAKIRVHRMGVDTKLLPYVSPAQENRPFKLLSVGRLVEKKGIQFGIAAIKSLSKMTHDEITYDIIGDGPLRACLEEQIATDGLTDTVKLLGEQNPEACIAAMQRADVLIVPSVTAADGDQEGIPVVLMEAMSLGLPVITTRHSGIPELVENNFSGLLTAEHDSDGIARAILKLMGDRKQMEALARNARDTVEANFNNDILGKQLSNLITSSLAGF